MKDGLKFLLRVASAVTLVVLGVSYVVMDAIAHKATEGRTIRYASTKLKRWGRFGQDEDTDSNTR